MSQRDHLMGRDAAPLIRFATDVLVASDMTFDDEGMVPDMATSSAALKDCEVQFSDPDHHVERTQA